MDKNQFPKDSWEKKEKTQNLVRTEEETNWILLIGPESFKNRVKKSSAVSIN